MMIAKVECCESMVVDNNSERTKSGVLWRD